MVFRRRPLRCTRLRLGVSRSLLGLMWAICSASRGAAVIPIAPSGESSRGAMVSAWRDLSDWFVRCAIPPHVRIARTTDDAMRVAWRLALWRVSAGARPARRTD